MTKNISYLLEPPFLHVAIFFHQTISCFQYISASVLQPKKKLRFLSVHVGSNKFQASCLRYFNIFFRKSGVSQI